MKRHLQEAYILLEEFNNQQQNVIIDTVEFAGGGAAVAYASRVPEGINTYIEIPGGGDGAAIRDIGSHRGLRAKIRTSGPDRPTADELASTIARLHDSNREYKFTGGQHDPFTHIAKDGKPLFGFFNTMVAAALAEQYTFNKSRIDKELVEAVLAETDPKAVTFQKDGSIMFRDTIISSDAVTYSRRRLRSIGSCSFSEMVDGTGQIQFAA